MSDAGGNSMQAEQLCSKSDICCKIGRQHFANHNASARVKYGAILLVYGM